MRSFVAILVVTVSTLSLAGEVIDLGKLNVEGAARGPEIQFIRPLSPDQEAMGKLLLAQVQELESLLLKPSPESEATKQDKRGNGQ